MEKIESRLSEMSIKTNDVQLIDSKWGWPLKELYRLALSFYKGKKILSLPLFLFNFFKKRFYSQKNLEKQFSSRTKTT